MTRLHLLFSYKINCTRTCSKASFAAQYLDELDIPQSTVKLKNYQSNDEELITIHLGNYGIERDCRTMGTQYEHS